MPIGSEGWGKLPLCLPIAEKKLVGLFTINGQKAWDAGFVNRPLAETIKDVSGLCSFAGNSGIDWANTRRSRADFRGLEMVR